MQTQNIEDRLSDLISSLQLDDAPAGGSVVVYHKSNIIAEVSVGKATPYQEWSSDTLSLNFSTGKGVLMTLIHILASQEMIDYDSPIAAYWPEFAQNNKQSITIKDALTHRAGLFDVRSVTESAEDMLDWPLMLSRVEQMPAKKPENEKAQSAYSALVSGWVLGGLVEKVTNLPLNEALETYLAKPLGVEGALYFGVPESKVGQVATLVKNFNDFDTRIQVNAEKKEAKHQAKSRSAKPMLRNDTEDVIATYQRLPSYQCWQQLSNTGDGNAKAEGEKSALKTLEIAKLYFDMRSINVQDFRHALEPTGRQGLDYYRADALMAKIPAATNVASAKALATMYAMLANKGVWQGKTLIRPEIFDKLSTIYVKGQDAIMAADAPKSMHWRLGYHRLFSRCQSQENLKHAFGHMGYNGSVAWCDTERNLAVAYVHNYDVTMSTDVRQFAIIEAIMDWL